MIKLGIYDVINDPLPQIIKIKDIIVNEDDFQYESRMVDIMNEKLYMDKLSVEHAYAIALTASLYPRGILQCNIGDCKGVKIDSRLLGTGLLLLGAERFYLFHNHPGYSKEISLEDKKITDRLAELGDLIGIELEEHVMITKDYWERCSGMVDEKLPFS